MAAGGITRRAMLTAGAAMAFASPVRNGRAQTGRVFVALAIVAPDARGAWDRFVVRARRLFERHGMAMTARFDVIGGDERLPLSDVLVITVPSARAFRAYLADPEFGALEAARREATVFFAVADGQGVTDGTPTPGRTHALTISRDERAQGRLWLDMTLDTVGAVIGDPGPLRDARRLSIRPITGDDDPQFGLGEGTFAWGLLPA